jgi:hypothetical protein
VIDSIVIVEDDDRVRVGSLWVIEADRVRMRSLPIELRSPQKPAGTRE